MDDLTREQMQEYRGNDAGKPSRPSPYRDRTPEENLDLFRRMRAGEFADGEKDPACQDRPGQPGT